MKLRNNITYTFILVAGLILSCSPEQEVEPVDSIDDNPVVTITPAGDYSAVSEGDVLTFDISLDKPMQYPLTFDIALADGSTVDGDDFTTEGATVAAYSTSATIEVAVAGDGDPEEAETLAFTFVPDFHWDWQINAKSIKEPVTASVKDLTFNLDWSEGSYDGADLCESDVDLDLFVLNEAQTAGNFGGATGACPVEYGNLGLPEDTYGIYVQLYNHSIPMLANVPIPYVVSFKGGAFVIEGEFSSDDPNETTHAVGQLVVSGGTHTIYDKNGAELGKL